MVKLPLVKLKVLWLRMVLPLYRNVDSTSCPQPLTMTTQMSMLDNTESDSITALATLPLSWLSKCKTMMISLSSENGIQRKRMHLGEQALMANKTLLVVTQFAASSACASTAFSTLCSRKLLIFPEMEKLNQSNISKSKNPPLEVQQLASAGLESSSASSDTTFSSPQSSTS